jgi:hypothetical protein
MCLFVHKAPPMDALKYPAHLYNTAHNFFAFLANALVCILNNLAIKIWAGLFYLGNHCDIQSTNRGRQRI